MVAVVAEDGGSGSFVGGWRPRRLCSFGGGGAGTWASLGWYIFVVVRLWLWLSGCHGRCPIVCHIGGNEVAPGKREVRARGLLN